MSWHQIEVRLKPRPRGIHLVTEELLGALPVLKEVRVGLLHLLIQHTSASLSLSENADPDVRADMRRWLDQAVPENACLPTDAIPGGQSRDAKAEQSRNA